MTHLKIYLVDGRCIEVRVTYDTFVNIWRTGRYEGAPVSRVESNGKQITFAS